MTERERIAPERAELTNGGGGRRDYGPKRLRRDRLRPGPRGACAAAESGAVMDTKRIRLGLALLLSALAVLAGITAMVVINERVGLWEPGQRLEIHEFRPGSGPAPMVGEVGSGLHLPLGGGR